MKETKNSPKDMRDFILRLGKIVYIIKKGNAYLVATDANNVKFLVVFRNKDEVVCYIKENEIEELKIEKISKPKILDTLDELHLDGWKHWDILH